jgi:hypothetical protein
MLGSSTTVLGNLSIEGGQGDDDIIIWSLAVAGSVDISTSHGSDEISLNSAVAIGGDFQVRTGVHRDQISVQMPVTVEGSLLLRCGQADDMLRFGGILYPLFAVSGGVSLYGDRGIDRIFANWPLERVIIAGDGVEIVGFE